MCYYSDIRASEKRFVSYDAGILFRFKKYHRAHSYSTQPVIQQRSRAKEKSDGMNLYFRGLKLIKFFFHVFGLICFPVYVAMGFIGNLFIKSINISKFIPFYNVLLKFDKRILKNYGMYSQVVLKRESHYGLHHIREKSWSGLFSRASYVTCFYLRAALINQKYFWGLSGHFWYKCFRWFESYGHWWQ